MSLYLALQTVENNKNKKSVKVQGDMLNFCDFIQVYVFSSNHHLNQDKTNFLNPQSINLWNWNINLHCINIYDKLLYIQEH